MYLPGAPRWLYEHPERGRIELAGQGGRVLFELLRLGDAGMAPTGLQWNGIRRLAADGIKTEQVVTEAGKRVRLVGDSRKWRLLTVRPSP